MPHLKKRVITKVIRQACRFELRIEACPFWSGGEESGTSPVAALNSVWIAVKRGYLAVEHSPAKSSLSYSSLK